MARPIIDLTGNVFERLTVISLVPKEEKGHAKWLVRCECGKKKVVSSSFLRSSRRGVGKDGCGCFRRVRMHINPPRLRHGATSGGGRTKTYDRWIAMRSRCLDKNNPAWKYYGGRGIKICKRWEKFENFLLDMGEKPKSLSLDRKNNNGNYTPKNCRWATARQQVLNRRKRGQT